MLKTVKEKKLKILLQDNRNLYHTQDLAVLWGIDNPNTLYTTIKRYVKSGIINPIYKGFYSTVPLNEINPFLLGLISLQRYGYISTESVLIKNGIIFQDIKYITLISNVSKKFQIADYNFLVRKMKSKYLYNDIGIIHSNDKREASTERAVADMLYFNPDYHFDNEKSINWPKVKEIQKTIGY